MISLSNLRIDVCGWTSERSFTFVSELSPHWKTINEAPVTSRSSTYLPAKSPCKTLDIHCDCAKSRFAAALLTRACQADAALSTSAYGSKTNRPMSSSARNYSLLLPEPEHLGVLWQLWNVSDTMIVTSIIFSYSRQRRQHIACSRNASATPRPYLVITVQYSLNPAPFPVGIGRCG